MSREREGYVTPTSAAQTSLKEKRSIPMSWMWMNSKGEETILDVNKHTILNLVQLHARDFRIIDPLLMYPSAILRREKFIILNLEHIKAIVTADQVFIRDPMDDNVIPIVEELKRTLMSINSNSQSHGMDEEVKGQSDDGTSFEYETPFEFRVLEVALEAVCSFLDARTIELENVVYPTLNELTLKISCRNLSRIRKFKGLMTRLTARVQKVKDELENLLRDDNDMIELHLSRKLCASPASRYSEHIGDNMSITHKPNVVTTHGDENDVDEIEMLLEAYYTQIDETFNRLIRLREYTDYTEDYINIKLDRLRNQLFKLLYYLSAGCLTMNIYSLIASIFCLGFPYEWNKGYPYMFKWVTLISGVFSAIIYAFLIIWANQKGLNKV